MVLVGLIIWSAVGPLAQKPGTEVNATEYAEGDCFVDFDAAAESNRTVPCTESHSAQLVGSFTAEADEPYPGRDSLEERAGRLCQAETLALPEATDSLKQRTAYPSEEGWASGDRRLDCFIESTAGNTLTGSFLK
ncbi:septum formation family protein [Sinomonas halotolerans]|uniref:Septum formation family protein n=1 Tax=Sinomonas halotolerans TaxID=1644133 RepID=A0ABU9X227_9MICC